MNDDPLLGEAEVSADAIAETLNVASRQFASVLRSGLKNALIEGKSLETVLKRAALSFSNRQVNAALAPLTRMVGQGASQLFGGIGFGLGGLVSGTVRSVATKAIPFAEGGVLGSPTAVGLGGGRVGLMGEAGREAVLPLARGTDGRLGVALEGEGRGAPTVVVNISTPDVEGFRRSEAQLTATLARAVARGRRGL